MEMFYLVAKIGLAITVMPSTYSKDQCEAVGLTLDSNIAGNFHYCVPAPKTSDYCIYHFDTFQMIMKNDGMQYAVTKKVCD